MLEKLKSFEHTFTAWVAKQYAKLVAAEPTIQAVAATVFKYAIPALQMVLAALGQEAAADIIAKVVGEAQQDLHAASSLLYDFGEHPTIAAIIAGVQKNLSDLLTAGHIKSTGTIAIVQKVVSTLGALVAAFAPAAA